MKIKNFAFFGVMASILGVCAANADTPTAKRIASTHYVDETVAPKQDKLDTTAGTGNVTFTGDGNAITGVSASGDGTVQFTKGATFLTASDVSGKVDIAQGVGHENHIVITDANGDVTTAATIPNTQVSGLGTAATRDAGAFQAYGDSTVGPGTYNVISDGNQVGKNLIKLDDGKQNKSDSRVPAAEPGQEYLTIQQGINVGTNLVKLDHVAQELVNNKQNKSDSNVPTLGQGQSYNAITSGNSVGTNLVALDTAIGTLSGTAGDAVQGVNATVSGTGEAITAVAENATTHNLDLTKSQLTYAGAMNNALPEINGTANWTTANCTDDDPCVLTMKSNGVFVWTHMVTQ